MRSVRSVRLSERERRLIAAAATLEGAPETVFLRAAGVKAAHVVIARSCEENAVTESIEAVGGGPSKHSGN